MFGFMSQKEKIIMIHQTTMVTMKTIRIAGQVPHPNLMKHLRQVQKTKWKIFQKTLINLRRPNFLTQDTFICITQPQMKPPYHQK